MAKISNIIYCLNTTNQENNGGLNANGIISAITPDYVPGAFSFSVIVTILDIETSVHVLDAMFIAPDGEKLVNIKGANIPQDVNMSNLPKAYRGINISMDWQNIVFKTSGIYKLIVKFDGEDLGTHLVFVKGKNEK